MQYEEMVNYIEEIPKFTRKHALEDTREFIKKLGDPCHTRKVIHVAGTNGKGSVCAYLQAILLSEGKSVGLFTSPHLVKLNERIQVNGEAISDETFVACFTKVKEIICQIEEEGGEHPSYFEFLYGLGLLAFEESGVEYIILETGLGGRLDATNSFAHPILTILTSIGLDHMGILGDTISEIAREKAGIIKERVPVIYDGSSDEAGIIIEETAKKRQAPCRKIGKDAFEIQKITDKQVAFSILNGYDKNTLWTINGTGVYQAMNAVLALTAAREVLGESANERKWKMALENVCWPGRMEEVLPGVILDGAHNLPAVESFLESMKWQKKAGKTVILFSAVSDKDYRQMIECLCKNEQADLYIISRISDLRGTEEEVLESVFRQHTDKPVIVEENLQKAFEKGVEEKGKDGRLYCLGSLYLIGELKELIGEHYVEF